MTTGVTTTSNTKTTLSVNIPEDTAYTCQFNFAKNDWVRKHFTLVTKGCKTPSIGNGTFTPVSELSKVAPNTELTFSCTNSTKYQLTGAKTVKCSDKVSGDPKYFAYSAALPTCKFVGKFFGFL